MEKYKSKPRTLIKLRPAKVNFYLRYMLQQGFDSEQVLEGTGITLLMLEDPHCLVELSKYIRIISNINRLSRAPSLAFALGEHLKLGDLGILGYSVMSCENTDEATNLWHQFNPVFFGNLIEMKTQKVGNQLLLTYISYADIREDLLQFLIEEKICYDVALHRLIGLGEFPAHHLTLTYPAPSHAACYSKLIHCPIEFSAERNTLRLWDNAMSLPLQGHDAETHQHCLKLLNEVFNSVNVGSTISHKVRAILYENIQLQLSIKEVAEQLCIASRTLNRKLGKEHLNFTEINVATRLEVIKNLLATTHMDSNAIADWVGFSDVRSLRRFLKSHTGKTIQQFRKETFAGGFIK